MDSATQKQSHYLVVNMEQSAK